MLVRDIAQLLQVGGVGTLGVDIFLGQLPASPDNVAAVYEYAGEPPELHSNIEFPSVQVLVRDRTYSAGRQRIGQVLTTLHGFHETVVSGKRYLLIKANQSPAFLERDDNNRVIFVINFTIFKEV